MSYATIADGLKTILRTIIDFNGPNVTLADYKVLTGGNSQAIVIFPGGFTQSIETFNTSGDYFIQYEVEIQVFVRYKTDPEAASKLAAYRQAIIEKVNQYPTLDGVDGVLFAMVTRGDAPIPVFNQDGTGPFYWLQTLVCSVQEDLSVASLE